jgi:hypothetical protein
MFGIRIIVRTAVALQLVVYPHQANACDPVVTCLGVAQCMGILPWSTSIRSAAEQGNGQAIGVDTAQCQNWIEANTTHDPVWGNDDHSGGCVDGNYAIIGRYALRGGDACYQVPR